MANNMWGPGRRHECVEKQKQLFPSSHSPLGISPKARDSHIPTAWHRPGWKSGKPRPGFPLSHAGLATTTTACLNLEPKTKKGDRPLRGRPLTLQDHLVLETEPDFRIILGLENAWIPPCRFLAPCEGGGKKKIFNTTKILRS